MMNGAEVSSYGIPKPSFIIHYPQKQHYERRRQSTGSIGIK